MKLNVSGIKVYNGKQFYEVEYENKKYFVNLYKFQEGEVVPGELDCNVKLLDEGKVSVTQNIIPFLEERYSVGEVSEFIVRNDFKRSGYYELVDKDGFYFRLDTMPELVLYIGQVVTCRVIEMQGANVKLDLISLNDNEDESRLGKEALSAQMTEDFLAEFIQNGRFQDVELEWDLAALVRMVFVNEEPYAAVVNEYILDHIKDLMRDNDYEKLIVILKQMRDAILYVLEETDCLSGCEANQRKVLQSRLSVIGVTIKSYVKVIGYFAKGQVEEKVNRLLNNLRVSGYVFQAEKQLGIMMLIFSLDHKMMENQMATLLKIIHSKDVKYWKDEPFRTAFIKLLELFIEYKREQMDLAIYDVKNVKWLLEALSMQLLLGNAQTDGEIFDYNLNRAMFYRYASYLKTSTPRVVLQNAFLSLMDVNETKVEYSWNDTEMHDLLASKLSTDISKGMDATYEKVYKEGDVKLELTDDGIVLKSLQVPENRLKNALPTDFLGWNHIQVKIQNGAPTIHSQKTTDLKVYSQLWGQVERELFAKEDVPIKKKVVKKRPAKGDSYDIRVMYKDENSRLVCRIVSEEYEGDGYLYPKDIVPYNINMYPNLFKNRKTGNTFLFEAKVVNIDAEDKCQFTLQPYLNDALKEVISYTDMIVCLITGQNENGYMGINSEGASVRFNNSEEFPGLSCNDLVFATGWEFASNSCYTASISGTEGVGEQMFTQDQAFNNLMFHMSHEDYREFEENANSEVVQQETLLDRSGVKELMNLIDRVAVLENEYLVTYNYLGFGKMLARMIDDQKRYDFYAGWMNLIAILHHVAVNMVVPTKDLNEFENSSVQMFSKHSEIYRKYIQLKIVSLKGKPEYNTQLWEFIGDEEEDVRGLAECVLAYNLLGNRTDVHTQQSIEERIAAWLKVKDHSSKLQDFGDEDLHTEFKTSLVYPSNNNMQPNLQKQTNEILKEVCAMLNAEGGHLYIGVNDCGVGVGMDNDLTYPEFNGMRDKYDLYLRNQVCQHFGRNVDAYVKTQFKEYAGRLIYEIEVSACPQTVRMEGVVYERHGSSKIALEGENERLFMERRQEFFARWQNGRREMDVTGTNGDAVEASVETQDENKLQEFSAVKKVRSGDRIQASRLRGETPLSYEDNTGVVRYIQFMNNSYQMVSDYYGPDEEVCLTLAIAEEDESKYLILAYEDGKVCKVPVVNILGKEDYQQNVRYNGARLVFVDIAADDDVLMTVGMRKRKGECVRFDTIETIAQKESLTSSGENVSTASFENYVQFDIIPASQKLYFREYTDINEKQPGRTIVRGTNDKYYQRLKELGVME